MRFFKFFISSIKPISGPDSRIFDILIICQISADIFENSSNLSLLVKDDTDAVPHLSANSGHWDIFYQSSSDMTIAALVSLILPILWLKGVSHEN